MRRRVNTQTGIDPPAVAVGHSLIGNERQRLQLRNLKRLAAANVGAGELVIPPHHIGLCFGESRSVALVGVTRQLRPLPPNYPGNFVFPRLAALGAGQCVAALLRRFVEKFPLFHGLRLFP